jgi:histidine ammonia-lyase
MIPVGQKPLTLDDFSDILNNKKKITLDGVALEKVAANFRFLKRFSADKLIYGINTGFGPMAQYKVEEENLLQLQYNLIRSHCSGSGGLLPPELAKATMITRLNSLMQAYSGVHP